MDAGPSRSASGLACLFLTGGRDVLDVVLGQLVEIRWAKFNKNSHFFLNGVTHLLLRALNQ